MYSQLADIYDEMYAFKDYAAESSYVATAIRARRPTACTLLETACGTGKFLEHLRRDFEVTGLDLSDSMLARARARLADIPLHLADMTCFDLGRQFDVVSCLFRSIAHCKTEAKFRDAIHAMTLHVRPGGLLVIEPYFTPDNFWDDHVALNQCRRDHMKLAWMYVQKRQGTQVLLDIHCLIGTAQGTAHFNERVELGLFDKVQYQDAFSAANLHMEHDNVGPSGLGLYIGSKPAT